MEALTTIFSDFSRVAYKLAKTRLLLPRVTCMVALQASDVLLSVAVLTVTLCSVLAWSVSVVSISGSIAGSDSLVLPIAEFENIAGNGRVLSCSPGYKTVGLIAIGWIDCARSGGQAVT